MRKSLFLCLILSYRKTLKRNILLFWRWHVTMLQLYTGRVEKIERGRDYTRYVSVCRAQRSHHEDVAPGSGRRDAALRAEGRLDDLGTACIFLVAFLRTSDPPSVSTARATRGRGSSSTSCSRWKERQVCWRSLFFWT